MTQSRRALITGGAKGLGLAIARRLAREGVTLALLGRDRTALQTASRELDASYEVADVTQPEMLAAAIARLGPCDILVNNAGAATSQPFLKSTPDDWAAMIAVNLTSAFAACHAVLPHMLACGWGRIINISSTAGLKGYAYTASYSAAKHGVIGLTRALAIETRTDRRDGERGLSRLCRYRTGAARHPGHRTTDRTQRSRCEAGADALQSARPVGNARRSGRSSRLPVPRCGLGNDRSVDRGGRGELT